MWRALGRPAVVLGVSLVVGIGLLFLPIDYHFEALSHASEARDFLSTLWQVEAGTIALTLSLILVAFEAIWRGRFRGSVRRFAEEVGLLYAVAAAFVSLVTIGVCLLGWGEGAPAGWAATWTVCLSGVAYAAIPVVLIRTLLLMNPSTVHERRLAQIRGEVHDAVDEEAFERLAYGELNERAERESSLDLQPILVGEVDGGLIPLESSKAGIVSDIRIGRIARMARDLQKGDEKTLVLATRGWPVHLPRQSLNIHLVIRFSMEALAHPMGVFHRYSRTTFQTVRRHLSPAPRGASGDPRGAAQHL
jgi:hypothetical protein